ncbi:MAG: CFI-box-CTERM domain-containing protein, partial [Ginsengibacter sp.]
AGAPGGLPAGVMLGVRSVDVVANGDILIAPAIGSFGSVIQKFADVAPPAPTNKTCFIATAVHGSNSIEVLTLRTFRDEVLLKNSSGRRVVALYERMSPPVATIIAKSKLLKAIVRKIIVSPVYLFAKRRLKKHTGSSTI